MSFDTVFNISNMISSTVTCLTWSHNDFLDLHFVLIAVHNKNLAYK
jgi:hypothetical protein